MIIGNRENKSFQRENHFDDLLIQVIRNFDTKKKKFKQGNDVMMLAE